MSESITLTPEIIAIMEQAGISEVEIKKMANTVTITKVRAKLGSGERAASEYILANTRHCKLCGTEVTTSYYMRQCVDSPSVLESVQIVEGVEVPSGLPEQARYKVWSTCTNCKDYLVKLPKEELANMILALHTRKVVWK